MKSTKSLRRMYGFLSARLGELKLESFPDPRRPQGRRWKISSILSGVVAGLFSGCHGLPELEELTAFLPKASQKLLGVRRRLPDTTARNLLCKLSLVDLVKLLHKTVNLAQRRKAFAKQSLPIKTVAMDGKVTALPTWDGPFAQKQNPEDAIPYGLMKTVTCTLVSTPSRPCIHVSPIPSETNEMGHFKTAFDELHAVHENLFDLVTYDAGANGEENARHVVDSGKAYLLRMNDERRHMQKLAQELVDLKDLMHTTQTVLSNHCMVRHSIRIQRTYNNVLPPKRKPILWTHTLTILRIDRQRIDNGVVTEESTRYYASSLDAAAMSVGEWMKTVIAHWGVETTHQILDTAFKEDEHPWITGDADGMLNMLVLRRIAYTLLSIFRSVTLRSEDNRHTPWKSLMRWVHATLIATQESMVEGLRARKQAHAFH